MDFAVPEKNVKQMGLTEGMHVADLGAGSGHYSFAAAHIVGNSGKVHAVEVQKELLKRLKNQAELEGLHNIDITWGDIEEIDGTKLRDNSIDVAILSNTLFQVEDKEGTLKEAYRILKPDGRLVIIDWKDSFGGMGPEPDAVVGDSSARELAQAVGFNIDSSINAGEHHYGVIVKK